MKPAATNTRNFRTFLLMAQLEAKQIGARIKQARKEAGMTQEQVADVATFSVRSLQDYENGVTIPYKNIREISGLLDRPVQWFLRGREEEAEDVTEPAGIHLEDIEEKLDRLTAIVETMAERLEVVPGASGGRRSAGTS